MALTPSFSGHRRMGLLNHASPTGSNSSDAVMEEEENSVLSSPPRSATPRSRLNLFFEQLNNHDDDDSPEGESPDQNDRFASTRNRRLFAEEDDDDNNNDPAAGESAAAVPKSSAAVPRGATDRLTPHKGRRPRRKPLSIDTGGGGLFGSSSGSLSNHSMNSGSQESLSTASSPSDSNHHHASHKTGSSYPRKRSSADRRSNDDDMHTSPHVSPNSLAFMTMDGRFVQSKNPFSSPMMTEESEQTMHHIHPALQASAPRLPQEDDDEDDDHDGSNRLPALSPPPHQSTHYHGNNTKKDSHTSPPPPNSPSKKMAGFLAPRQSPPLASATTAIAATPMFGATTASSYGPSSAVFLNGGFPDKRYSFTGSPIPEQPPHNHINSHSPFLYNRHNTAAASSKNAADSSPDDAATTATDAMETDTIHSRDNSWEGFHKVRRLHKQHDDIAKASTYQARSSLGRSSVGSALTVDSTLDEASMDSSTAGSGGGAYGNFLHKHNPAEHDDISPTDVLSFPFSPAAKDPSSPYTKNNTTHHHHQHASQQPQQYYPSVRKKAPSRPVPPTPVAERRRQATQAARTAQSSYRPQKRDTKAHPTSRFYGDFDVISQLGNGAFGTVYKVLSRLDGVRGESHDEHDPFLLCFTIIMFVYSQPSRVCSSRQCMYAIKAAKRKAKGPADRDRMLKEVYALAALSDQADTATFHIVRYHQAWMEEDRLYIQTEICQGNLEEEMNKTLVTVPRRYKLMREICLALGKSLEVMAMLLSEFPTRVSSRIHFGVCCARILAPPFHGAFGH